LAQDIPDNATHEHVRHFEHRSFIPASLAAVKAFHERPEALFRLTPPPIFVQIIGDERVSLLSGELEFRLWFGPLPVRWLVRQGSGPIADASFSDTLFEGPLAHWEHQHIFTATQDGVELIDRIALAHKAGWRGRLSRLMFDGAALRLLFYYRHWRTRRDVLRGRD
jgi:ligand-binding SRPBCC domain-containing protein